MNCNACKWMHYCLDHTACRYFVRGEAQPRPAVSLVPDSAADDARAHDREQEAHDFDILRYTTTG